MKDKKFIVMTLIALLIGGGVGFGLGFVLGIDQVISRAVKLIPIFTNITINEAVIHDAIYRYNNNLGGCYNNALIYNNSGN